MTFLMLIYSDYNERQFATQEFSEYLRNYRWAYGRACDDDMVVFFSANEKQVGYDMKYLIDIFTWNLCGQCMSFHISQMV